MDLLEVERLERALERRPRLDTRLFSEDELEYAEGRARPGRHLAARFAAKEAVVKALPAEAIPLSDVEVVAGTPPVVRLHGRARDAAEAAGLRISVSLTHSRETAAAVAIAQAAA